MKIGCKEALDILETTENIISLKDIRKMVKNEKVRDEWGADSIWIGEQDAMFQIAVKKNIRSGHYKLWYRSRMKPGEWVESMRDIRGNSPTPQYPSIEVGLIKA